MFYFHPYLEKISNLTNVVQMGRNHQLEKDDGGEIDMMEFDGN